MTTRVKFHRIKQFETIRRVSIENEAGERIRTVAFIGMCKELHENLFILEDNVAGNESKWLVIVNDEDDPDIFEFDDLETAKEYCRETF